MSRLLKVFLLIGCIVTVRESFSQTDTTVRNETRMAPGLFDADPSEVIIQLNDTAAFFHWMKRNSINLFTREISPGLFTLTGLRSRQLFILQNADGLAAIDRVRRAREETLPGDYDLSVNTVNMLHAKWSSVSGEGMMVSIKEKPFDTTDLDLRGRVFVNEHFDEEASLHATYMASIAAGGGNSHPDAKAAGWGARLTSSDFTNLFPDDHSKLAKQGVTVQNHSYGVGIENYYGLESESYDRACHLNPGILHVFSSGNEGTASAAEGMYAGIPGYANLTGQFKVSKNTIVVGSSTRTNGVASLSSRGPAHDGRIKPELVAFGDAGSSEGAALVSGIALAVQEAYRDSFGEMPESALVKAILINSADDVGRPGVDFASGFGNADAVGAVTTTVSQNFFSGVAINESTSELSIEVPSGTSLLKVTLAWNDPPAIAFTDTALVNDLDLTLISGTDEWLPWILDASPSGVSLEKPATRGRDRLNNVEQVTLRNPAPGTYNVRVDGHAVKKGPQTFYVAWEVLSGLTWTFPSSQDAVQSKSEVYVRWKWHGDDTIGRLEFKAEIDTQWQILSDNVLLTDNYFLWKTPDENGSYRLRIVSGDEAFESDSFVISSSLDPDIGFNCDDALMIAWQKVGSSSGYAVYGLGDRYMEPLLMTTDTFAILDKSTLATAYLAVEPLMSDGRSGVRSGTFDYELQGTGCYIVSFFSSTYFYSEPPGFHLVLGTTAGLESVIFERREADGYKALHEISLINSVSFSFTDPSAPRGPQVYRVRLVTDKGNEIVSEDVEIFVVAEDDMFVFPNPVPYGELINVVIHERDAGEVTIIDSQGRKIRQQAASGDVRLLVTDRLDRGTYVIQTRDSNGNIRQQKLIVL